MDVTKSVRLVYFGSQHKPTWLKEYRSNLPETHAEEVLVKVRLATICVSDLHTIAGKRSEPCPAVLGHEAICEVIEDKRTISKVDINGAASQSIPLRKGTRVTFSVPVSCNQCRRCNLGYPQKCEILFKYGHATVTDGSGYNGCYATHMVLRERTHIVPVPPQVSDKVVCPANCALATVVNAVEQARTTSSNRLAIVQGAGILGLYACALLRHKGYTRVICCDEKQSRLPLVKKFGGEPCYESITEVDTDFADCVIEACGSPCVLTEGMVCIRHGGVYVWVGMVHPDSQLPITGEDVIRKCITIKGVHNYQARHLDEAIKFLSETWDKHPYEELVSLRTYGLDEFEEAIHVANSKTFHRVAIQP